MRLNKLLVYLFNVLILNTSGVTHAQENIIAELQAQGQLNIAVSIEQAQEQSKKSSKESSLVVKQQVILNVELLSKKPFKDNFSLTYFDLENTVVIPASAEAALNIKIIDEQQWFVQSKKISIYPLEAGNYTVPSLTAAVAVMGDNDKVFSGDIVSKPISFSAELPTQLNGIDNFVVSPNVSFTLKQSKSKPEAEATADSQASSYDIGSAVTFIYTIKADNMHVMMLDKLNIPIITGVKTYHKPNSEKDVFDRFEKFNTAELKQAVTFIFQQQGQFTIPKQSIVWWDINNGTANELNVEAQTFTIGKGGKAGSSNQDSKASFTSLFSNNSLNKDNVVQGLMILIIVIFVLAIIRKVFVRRHTLAASFHRVNKTRQKQLAADFNEHVKASHYQAAITCLYQLTKQASGSVASLSALIDKENNTRLQALQSLAYNEDVANTSFTTQDGELMLSALLKKQSKWQKKARFTFSSTLNPNP